MTTIASRKSKGRNLQKWLRDLVLGHFPELLPDDVRNTPMGSTGTDLMLSPRALEVFPYAPECKADENRSIWHCWAQANKNAIKGKPLLVMKKNYHDALGVMKATDLMELIAENYNLKRGK